MSLVLREQQEVTRVRETEDKQCISPFFPIDKTKVVIVGGTLKEFNNPEESKILFYQFLDNHLDRTKHTIISGRSDKGGIDIWVEFYARDNGFNFLPFPPNFILPSPMCYYERNKKMAQDGDEVWAFLGEHQSLLRSGAMQTIRFARKLNKPTKVYRIIDKVIEIKFSKRIRGS